MIKIIETIQELKAQHKALEPALMLTDKELNIKEHLCEYIKAYDKAQRAEH